MQHETLLFGHYLQLFGNLVDYVVYYYTLFAYELAAVFHACDKRYIIQQTAQTFIVGIASLYQFLTFLFAQVYSGKQCLQAHLDGCNGCLQLVVYVIGKLSLYAYLFLLFAQGGFVCCIPVFYGLLPLGI